MVGFFKRYRFKRYGFKRCIFKMYRWKKEITKNHFKRICLKDITKSYCLKRITSKLKRYLYEKNHLKRYPFKIFFKWCCFKRNCPLVPLQLKQIWPLSSLEWSEIFFCELLPNYPNAARARPVFVMNLFNIFIYFMAFHFEPFKSWCTEWQTYVQYFTSTTLTPSTASSYFYSTLIILNPCWLTI